MAEQSGRATAVDVITKTFGIAVAVMYGIGYAVISIHHAKFGIAQVDPLKPKIILTGLIFVLLTVISAIGAMRTLGLAGLTNETGIHIPASPEHKEHLQVVLGLGFFGVANGISF